MNDTQAQIEAWLEDTVDQDAGIRRPLFLNDEGRIFWHADEMDFDRDDTPVKYYYLDEAEGYNEDWFEEILENFMF